MQACVLAGTRMSLKGVRRICLDVRCVVLLDYEDAGLLTDIEDNLESVMC